MKIFNLIPSLLASAFCAVLPLAATSAKPNVIVIMADDLGYRDLGFQGSPVVKTPHLDKLAHGGVIFSDAHAAASVCSPSRAGFITGRYQQRFGHEANCPPNGDGMDTEEFTMGQAFQDLGYQTFLVGKWHLGNTTEQHPNARGFDEFYGLREGSRSYFCKENEKFTPHSMELNGEHVKFEGFLTDRMTDEAIRLTQSAGDTPFFLFLSYTAPHGPLQATKEDLQEAGGNPYHALIQNMDANIGRFVEDLKSRGKYENTIFWFLSDNGGTVGQASNYPLNGKKGIKLEGGQRVPFVFSWPAKVSEGRIFEGLTSAMDIFPTSYALAGGAKEMPKPLDGVNLWPHLTGETDKAPHEVLFWRKLEAKSVRKGTWKLILSKGLDPMLFDIKEDLGERQNVASKQPEIVSELTKTIETWETELVEPWWGEAKKWEGVRMQNYIDFLEAGELKTLGELKEKKK